MSKKIFIKTAEQLAKEMVLLEHGFYDNEVNEFLQKEVPKLLEGEKEGTSFGCVHSSSSCKYCNRKWWFEEHFEWKEKVKK